MVDAQICAPDSEPNKASSHADRSASFDGKGLYLLRSIRSMMR